MKKLLVIGAALAGLGVAAAYAGDDDSLAACKAFAERNDVPPDPCECIADAVSDDADLKAEQLALVTMDDYDASSDELHAAIDPCLDE